MPPVPKQTDPRREQLRQQALQRRQAVLDRIAATRSLMIGGVVAVSCILAGYLEASAHTRTGSGSTASSGFTAGGGASGYGSGYGSGSYGGSSNYGGSTQSLFGGDSPPSASSGGGSAISGGS